MVVYYWNGLERTETMESLKKQMAGCSEDEPHRSDPYFSWPTTSGEKPNWQIVYKGVKGKKGASPLMKSKVLIILL